MTSNNSKGGRKTCPGNKRTVQLQVVNPLRRGVCFLGRAQVDGNNEHKPGLIQLYKQ